MSMGIPDRIERIRTALTKEFAPTQLEITDQSALHAGHAGADGSAHTHISINIRSVAFAGVSRIGTHRRINAVLAAEFQSGLHAVKIEARPEEKSETM